MYDTLTELAKDLESFVDSNGIGYDTPKAILYGVKFTEQGGARFLNLATHGDVYELLNDQKSAQLACDNDAIGLLTCGWAAPVSDDDDADSELPPSVHPKRRRVRLLVVANRELNGMVSVLRFADDAQNPIIDEGKATGALADEVQNLIIRANANNN